MVDEFENEAEVSQDGPKALREALEKANKALAESNAKIAEFEKEKRTASVSKLVQEKGLNPGVAQFIPADADPSEWLEANASLFAPGGGVEAEQPAESVASQAQDIASQYAEGFQRQAQSVETGTARASVAPEVQELLEAAKRGPEAIAEAATRLTRGGVAVGG